MGTGWLKIEVCLPNKSEVIRLGRILGLSTDAVCGVLVRFWGWADANSVDGSVTQITLRDCDMIVALPGFADAMKQVGWLSEMPDGTGIFIPKFTRHNGESAKKRALNAERQGKYRNAKRNASVTQNTLPEKRREEVKEGASAPTDPGPVWKESLTILTEQGQSEPTARSFLGMLCRDYEESVVADAVRSAVGKANVVAYVRGVLRDQPKKGAQKERKLAL